ncbi:MAG: pseudouridine synthase [Victivallales bacterium]|nr:pseudouridine synthase [Victivallales bacterium]
MAQITVIFPVNRCGAVYLTPGAGGRPLALQYDGEKTPEVLLREYGLTAAAVRPLFTGTSPFGWLVRFYLAAGAETSGPTPRLLPPLRLAGALQLIEHGELDDPLTALGLWRLQAGGLVEEHFPLLYRDEWCVAVFKPAGMSVHRTRMDQEKDTLQLLLHRQLGSRVQPLHRLDRPTSGIVLFATDENALRPFFALFQQRKIRKTYWAVVRGFTDDAGVIDYPINRNDTTSTPVPAVTVYETVARVELPIPVGPYATARYSLVKIDLKTGRQHQIRRHFAHIRHPVLGDTVYGDGRHNRMVREHFKCRRLMLAALELAFVHPLTGAEVNITARPDASFRALLEQIGLTPDLH